MKVISIISQKGGAGKTTLAIHLATQAAASGYVAAIVDIDPQATAAAWGDWRQAAGKNDPEVITCPPARLAKLLEGMAAEGAEIVIIDTPPHADAAARAAAEASDLVLVPCRPRAFDLHAIRTTADLVKFTKRPAYVVFNAANTRAARQTESATEICAALGLNIAPVSLADRAAYHHSTAEGKTAWETDPKGKAAEEIADLWQWATNLLKLSNSRKKRKAA